jgi:hypothetical protein
MAELSSSSAYDIHIESVVLTSDRFNTEYELAPSISEINVFENIDLPYLTGAIMLSDSFDLTNKISFRGTEKINLKVRINGDETAKSVSKDFIVTDIKVVPTQDTSEMLRLNIIEEHAFLNQLITVSKAYDGKPEDIIGKIAKDQLDMEFYVPDEFSSSAVAPMKVVIPNMTPLDAIRWIKDRLVSPNGMPFFFYSTLNSDKPFLTNLEFMLAENIRNAERPFTYGQAFNRWSTTQNVLEQARNIESYNLPKSENMYGLVSKGAVSSTYEYIDTLRNTDTRKTQSKISMNDILGRMQSANIINSNQHSPIYDDKFQIDGKTFDDFNPSNISQITTSNTYSELANYYEAETLENQQLKAISRALRYYLLKSPIEISMPGFEFLGRGKNITIGRQILLNFLKNDPDILQNNSEALDKKRSGNYLIYAARHIIKPEKYSVSLSCVKLADQKA